jgi:DNA-binding winged helix-turn-helix (wHTH) protein/TolB-like protein
MHQVHLEKVICTAGLRISPESRKVIGGLSTSDEPSNNSIRLGPVNFKVLLVLLQNHGKVVSRGELFEQVWTNQVISDDSLTRSISDLRNQLSRLSTEKELIETIPKQGYRWLPVVDSLVESSGRTAATASHIKADDGEPKEIGLQQGKQHTKPLQDSNVDHQISSKQRNRSKSETVKGWVIWGALTIAGFMLLLFGFLWGVNQFAKTDVVAVVLMPIEQQSVAEKAIANQFESNLREKILQTDNIRFLSSRTLFGEQHSLYPRLAREFSVQWIIEATLRSEGQQMRLVVNIVEARTAIVSDSISHNISSENPSVQETSEAVLLLLQNNID